MKFFIRCQINLVLAPLPQESQLSGGVCDSMGTFQLICCSLQGDISVKADWRCDPVSLPTWHREGALSTAFSGTSLSSSLCVIFLHVICQLFRSLPGCHRLGQLREENGRRKLRAMLGLRNWKWHVPSSIVMSLVSYFQLTVEGACHPVNISEA